MVFVVDRMVMEVVETSDHNDEETEEDDIVITTLSVTMLQCCDGVGQCDVVTPVSLPHLLISLSHSNIERTNIF